MAWFGALISVFVSLICLTHANVELDECIVMEEDSHSVVLKSLSIDPYPIILHKGLKYDVAFELDVQKEISMYAFISATVARIGFYSNIPLPCLNIQDIIDNIPTFKPPGVKEITNTTMTPSSNTTTKTTTTEAKDTTTPKTASPTTPTPTTTTTPPHPFLCFYDMQEIFDWNDGSLCSAPGGNCSSILGIGTHKVSVQMTVPDWMDINFMGALDQYIAGSYILNLQLWDVTGPVGCSSITFELGDPQAPETTTPEINPENNVVIEQCGNSSESSLEVTSVLLSPYPITLHSYRSYDLLFSFNVTEEIPIDATVSVAVEGVEDDRVVPIPCITDLGDPEIFFVNDTCDYNLTQIFNWNNGALCDLFENGCDELREVGVHEGKVTMKVPAILGSIIAVGNLDTFIAGSYRLTISILDNEDEELGCVAITLELYKPPTTTTTSTTTTKMPDASDDAISYSSTLSFVLFFLYISTYF